MFYRHASMNIRQKLNCFYLHGYICRFCKMCCRELKKVEMARGEFTFYEIKRSRKNILFNQKLLISFSRENPISFKPHVNFYFSLASANVSRIFFVHLDREMDFKKIKIIWSFLIYSASNSLWKKEGNEP